MREVGLTIRMHQRRYNCVKTKGPQDNKQKRHGTFLTNELSNQNTTRDNFAATAHRILYKKFTIRKSWFINDHCYQFDPCNHPCNHTRFLLGKIV